MSVSPDQIFLTDEQRQHLARLAELSGRPWGVVLDEALSSFEQTSAPKSEDGETVYDALVRLGMLGSVVDGPADLSTNPKYMEGFGGRER